MTSRQLFILGTVPGVAAAGLVAPYLFKMFLDEPTDRPLLSLISTLIYVGITLWVIAGTWLAFPRIGRVLGIAGTLLSGSLFLLMAGGWLHSHLFNTNIRWHIANAKSSVGWVMGGVSERGIMCLRIEAFTDDIEYNKNIITWECSPVLEGRSFLPVSGTSFLNHLGLSEKWNMDRSGRCRLDLMLPWWLAGLAFLALPTWRGAGLLRRIRRERWELQAHLDGLCPHCRYDLRASEGRCPECGQTIDTPAAAQQPTAGQ